MPIVTILNLNAQENCCASIYNSENIYLLSNFDVQAATALVCSPALSCAVCRVKSGIFGQTAKFEQLPCLFQSSVSYWNKK